MCVCAAAAGPCTWSPAAKRFVNQAPTRPLGASASGFDADRHTGGFTSPSILRNPGAPMRYPPGNGSSDGYARSFGTSQAPHPADGAGGAGVGAMTPLRGSSAATATLMTPPRGTPGFNVASPLGFLSFAHPSTDLCHQFPLFSPDGVGTCTVLCRLQL
jgi:hypothetical protein